jgi:hypothetical protein
MSGTKVFPFVPVQSDRAAPSEPLDFAPIVYAPEIGTGAGELRRKVDISCVSSVEDRNRGKRVIQQPRKLDDEDANVLLGRRTCLEEMLQPTDPGHARRALSAGT